ncbi:MAG: RNA polymerase sigma factor [Alphaproteobacteria bacterium]|nr:MAG: RNA polymerase sigma factor [Alphaproteobacteria bacterium]
MQGASAIAKRLDKRAHVVRVLLEHQPSLKAMLIERLGSEADADEVLQETYIRVSTLDDPSAIDNPRAYVFRIATNLGIDRGRELTRRRALFVHDDGVAQSVPSDQPSPEQVAINRTRLRLIHEALLELPAKCRQAFLLSRRDGLTYKEIGARLGVSDNMVKKYLVRALVLCREKVGRC